MQRNPKEEKDRVVQLILPVGNYEIKMMLADGQVMAVEQMPNPRIIEVDKDSNHESCSGSIGITISNPTLNRMAQTGI